MVFGPVHIKSHNNTPAGEKGVKVVPLENCWTGYNDAFPHGSEVNLQTRPYISLKVAKGKETGLLEGKVQKNT